MSADTLRNIYSKIKDWKKEHVTYETMLTSQQAEELNKELYRYKINIEVKFLVKNSFIEVLDLINLK